MSQADSFFHKKQLQFSLNYDISNQSRQKELSSPFCFKGQILLHKRNGDFKIAQLRRGLHLQKSFAIEDLVREIL